MTLLMSNSGGVLSGNIVTISPQTFLRISKGAKAIGRVFDPDGTTWQRKAIQFTQWEPLTDWIIPNGAASSDFDVRLTNLVNVVGSGWGVTPSATIETDAATLQYIRGQPVGTNADTIVRTGGSSNFITEGFVSGMRIRVDRSPTSQNRVWTIGGSGGDTGPGPHVTATQLTMFLIPLTIDPMNNGGPDADSRIHGLGWESSTQSPGPGAADGDEDTWFNLGLRREWTIFDFNATAGVNERHVQFDFQIRFDGTTIASSAMDWHIDRTPSGGTTGGGCFVHGEVFRMEDGSLKEIQDIVPGDRMEEGGEVYQAIVGNGKVENWYDVNGMKVTGHHGIYKDDEWMRVHSAGYDQVIGEDVYYVVANEYHRMVAENGQLFNDFQEVDYMTTGWDDWVIDKMNGKTDDDAIREAILSTGTKSQRIKEGLKRDSVIESLDEKENRLNDELAEVEEQKATQQKYHSVTGRPILT